MRKYLIISLILALALSGMTVVTAQEKPGDEAKPQTPWKVSITKESYASIGLMTKAGFVGLTAKWYPIRTFFGAKYKKGDFLFLYSQKESSYLGEVLYFPWTRQLSIGRTYSWIDKKGVKHVTRYEGKGNLSLGLGAGMIYSVVQRRLLGIKIGGKKKLGYLGSLALEADASIANFSLFVGQEVTLILNGGLNLKLPNYIGFQLRL